MEIDLLEERDGKVEIERERLFLIHHQHHLFTIHLLLHVIGANAAICQNWSGAIAEGIKHANPFALPWITNLGGVPHPWSFSNAAIVVDLLQWLCIKSNAGVTGGAPVPCFMSGRGWTVLDGFAASVLGHGRRRRQEAVLVFFPECWNHMNWTSSSGLWLNRPVHPVQGRFYIPPVLYIEPDRTILRVRSNLVLTTQKHTYKH